MWPTYTGMNQAITSIYQLDPTIEVAGLRPALDSIDTVLHYNNADTEIRSKLVFSVWDKISDVTTANGIIWNANDLIDHLQAKSIYAPPGEIIFGIENNTVIEFIGHNPDVPGLVPILPSQTAELCVRKLNSVVLSRAFDFILAELIGLLQL